MPNDSRNDGGPAFPVPQDRAVDGSTYYVPTHPGMSLRDYFASQVISLTPVECVDDWSEMYAAKRAYQLADAMLKAREE